MRGSISTPKASSTLSITGIDFGIAETTDFTTADLRDTTEEVDDVVESRACLLTTDEAITDVTEIPESLFVECEIFVSV